MKIVRIFALLAACALCLGVLPSSSKAANTAVLSIAPASGTLSVGTPWGIDVMLNTGGQSVIGLSVALNYSANLSYASSSGTNSVFNVDATDPSPASGATHLSFTRLRFDNGYNGSAGEVLHLVFNPTAAGPATITVDQANTTIGTAATSNILSSANNGSYIVAGAASPTPTPTPTPTPSPSATPTATPTATATATPRATTVAAATSATPTPTVRPSTAANSTATPIALPKTGASPAGAFVGLTKVLTAIGGISLISLFISRTKPRR